MIVLDVETTGLKVEEGAEILEISAIKYDDSGREISKFIRKIKPKKDIPEFITELTGITYEDIKDAPMIEDVINELKVFLADETIIGHNVEFDLTFIKHFFEINGIKGYKPETIDTLTLARKKLKLRRNRLIDVANHFGIKFDKLHTAEEDCLVTKAIYDKLLDM